MKWMLGAALAAAMVVPAAAADKDAGKPASNFLRCDGRTGHVGAGESVLRLLLVTATAGLSEAGMSSDDAKKRDSGAAGVAACSAALQSEGDNYRRVQLGLAEAMHYAEDKNWQMATDSARNVPSLINAAPDWALARTAATSSATVEAWALLHQGKTVEAEDVAAKAVVRAGSDILALNRALPYLRLTPTMTEPKRRAFQALQRFAPQDAALVAHGYADAGDYASARTALEAVFALQNAMYKKGPSKAENGAFLASYWAMGGDVAAARQALDTARQAFAAERTDGRLEGGNLAEVDEELSFADAAIDAANGDLASARQKINARSTWANMPQGVVADLLGRLQKGAKPGELSGFAATAPESLWADKRAALMRILDDKAYAGRLWRAQIELAVDKHYAPMAAQALTGSTAKPKWLMKPSKDIDVPFEIITTSGRYYGAMVNEPMMLHAAYIARQRGKKGFVLFPTRKSLDMFGVKFVNPGEQGIRELNIIDASALIAQLEPHIYVKSDKP